MWSSQVADKDVDGEWEWGDSTSLGRKMAALESTLRCSICSDFFVNPHSLACGHVFCSECARKHLDPIMNPTTSGICPSCRHPASLALLRPCRDVETTLQHFKDVRPPLLLLVQSQHSDSHPTTDTNTSTTASSIPINTMKKLSHMDFHKQSKEKIKKAIEKLTVNSRKKLRLDGDKDALERRYRDFVHLHNAQLGSPSPLSVDQMVTEITRRENAKNGNAKKGNKSVQIAKDLKSGKESAEAKQGFSNLIQKIRLQKQLDKQCGKSGSSSSAIDSSMPPTELSSSKLDAADDTMNDSGSAAISCRNPIAEHGVWRVVHSDKYNVPFFFNSTLNTGQFKVPSELIALYPSMNSELPLSIPCEDCDDAAVTAAMEGEDAVPCTLVDSQLLLSAPPTASTSLIVEGTPPTPSHSQVFAEASSYSIAAAISQHCVPTPAMQYCSSVPRENNEESACDEDIETPGNCTQELEESSEDQNECPFCTFINPPLSLQCEICHGEITQLTPPVRRSQRIGSNGSSGERGKKRKTF